MRRRLFLVVLATTSLVVVAFALPLGALVRSVARDRAIGAAERDVAALAPVLALTTDPDSVAAALTLTDTGGDGRLAVLLSDDTTVGDATAFDPQAVALARDRRLAFSRHRGDGLELYTPVVTGTGTVSVVRARVPDERLDHGVRRAWTALAGVAVALVAAAAVVADRLARSVTRDATDLAGTARAIAGGQADARAEPGTTPELADAAQALNRLADRIDELRAAERERVADLSHRLRTPLTALRLDAEAAGNAELEADVDRLETAVSELVRNARRPLHGGAVSATCDVAEVVRDRARWWSALADDDGRTWTLDVDPDARYEVRLSAEEAAAAVDALVGNVFAHTPDGTPYALSLHAEDGTVNLHVDDAGPGIADPDAALSRGTTGAGSTGLGLDIARQAAEAAAGRLRLGPSPLGGARLTVELPLAVTSP